MGTIMADMLPELPAFLNRKITPMPELNRYQEAVLRLTPDQSTLVWDRLKVKFPKWKKPKGNFTAKQLVRKLLDAHMGQADAVMSIVHETTPLANSALETMIGKPITRLAAKKTKATGHGRDAFIGKLNKTDIIHLLVEDNPKKKGGDPWRRFELYKNGMTIEAALAAGVFPADIVWDTKHKFIELKHE